jgi:G3E family GTPase
MGTRVTKRKISITLVSGFHESGKSTLIEHLKKARSPETTLFLHDDGEIDLFAAIEIARQNGKLQSIVIECASNLEPFFVAEHLKFGDAENPAPRGVAVDTIVTAVDASRFLNNLFGSDSLADRGLAFDEADDRKVAELLIEQVEFCDVVLLNKTDLVSENEIRTLETLITRLNSRAKVLRSVRCKVDPNRVIATGLFSFSATDEGAGWLAQLAGELEHEATENGVSSFTYIENRPFHPQRFNQLMGDFKSKGVVRARGSVWIASRHNEIGVWSLAGQSSLLTHGGLWYAATPTRDWPRDEADRLEIMQDWVPPFGDRRQEIAFIGVGMNQAEISARLTACLLNSNEMIDGPGSWQVLEDPLPDWHEDHNSESFGDWS